jgi:hypothetical protein
MLSGKQEMRVTPEAVNAAKARLDQALSEGSGYVNIAFGPELFSEFRKRGWIDWGQFRNIAFPNQPLTLPAYGEGRYAFPSWDVPPNDFQIGSGA